MLRILTDRDTRRFRTHITVSSPSGPVPIDHRCARCGQVEELKADDKGKAITNKLTCTRCGHKIIHCWDDPEPCGCEPCKQAIISTAA